MACSVYREQVGSKRHGDGSQKNTPDTRGSGGCPPVSSLPVLPSPAPIWPMRPAERVRDLLVAGVGGRRSGDHQDVEALVRAADRGAGAPPAFCRRVRLRITACRLACRSRCRTDPARGSFAPVADDEQPVRSAAGILLERREVRLRSAACRPPRRTTGLPEPSSGGELLAALCAACREHAAATLGLHAGAEAVLLGAMALLGLIRLLGHRERSGASSGRAIGRSEAGSSRRRPR